MPGHEQFEELCALAASGQLDPEDWHALREHLQSCPACLELLGNFGKIGADLMAEFVDTIPSGRMDEMRSRFVVRARQAGGNLSNCPSPPLPTRRAGSAVLTGCIAASILLILGGLLVRTRRETPQEVAAKASARSAMGATRPEGQASEQFLAAIHGLERDKEALQARLNSATAQQVELESRIAQLTSQLDVESREAALAQSDRQDLAQRLAQVEIALDQARSKQSAQALEVASAQAQIDDLNRQLFYEKADSEREKVLLAAGKDGQGIIGARNLHIVDVYDADGRGKRRSFGRVFYVEGQELVFYAYDLSDPRHANAQFYAWGAGGLAGQAVACLGILHNDGQNEQRWVLKFNDPSVLSKLDSIFVTAETASNLDKPKGKRVLFAVLSGQPNHP